MNVLIRPSAHDWKKTEGLCGYLSGECGDDFVLRDETYSTEPEARLPCRPGFDSFYHLYPDDFSRSWKYVDMFD